MSDEISKYELDVISKFSLLKNSATSSFNFFG